MRLLESYSRSCSVPITTKPKITSKYFPLPGIDKYITIQTKSGMPAKDFSYFQEVLDILKPILDKQNIKIIHLGQDSAPLNNTINLNGQTNVGQAYYILKNSLCHISVDSWSVHAACAENVPCVALYGSTTVENHSPYHFDPSKSIFLESHRNGQKASFQREENPKTVDLILPEEVAKSVCQLLNIVFNYPYKTIFIGKSYQNRLIESIMDGVVNLQSLGIPNILCRMDKNYNLGLLIEQMKVGKVSIVTNKPLPLNILQQFKSQIVEIVYEIKLDSSPQFCREMLTNLIPFRMFSRLSEEQLNSIKLDYIDFPSIISRINDTIPDFIKNIPLDKLYFKSGKFLVSSKGLFFNDWAFKNNQKIDGFNSPPQKFTGKDISELNDLDYLLVCQKLD